METKGVSVRVRATAFIVIKMTRLWHYCTCKICKHEVQIANMWTPRDICDDYVCDSCKWKEANPEEWERIKNERSQRTAKVELSSRENGNSKRVE